MEINKDDSIVLDNKHNKDNQPNSLDLPKIIVSKFKANWGKTDTMCGECGAVKVRATGITKQNLKRLVIEKPTFYDWAFFFIIVMTLFMAYRYNIETAQSRYMSDHFDNLCMQKGYAPVFHNNSYTIQPWQINVTLSNNSDV